MTTEQKWIKIKAHIQVIYLIYVHIMLLFTVTLRKAEPIRDEVKY